MEGGWEGRRVGAASKRIWSALRSTMMQFFQEQLPMRRGHKHEVQQQRHVCADVRGTPKEQLSQEQHQGQQGAQVQVLSAALPACGYPRRVHSLVTALITHGDGYRTRSNVHDTSGLAATYNEEHYKSGSSDGADVTRTFAARARVQYYSEHQYLRFEVPRRHARQHHNRAAFCDPSR
ncbi:hypothetical protein EDB92DRAFT_1837956 [Lactarius akahatsu]|uniref:Uncharacterized protein n=1 Tax=Lactarius akahatsu TaxID=416441 RepID=A0AAD4QGS7_9AGAM|nr:hypothetical protein EDB92DRAFT_1918121 [Lactarius akahatsu]KAH8998104.1 hypothetical protein EDB92DRAFT_1837956 [Lactarius akahatsu]